MSNLTHKDWFINNSNSKKPKKTFRNETALEKYAKEIVGISPPKFEKCIFIKTYGKKIYDQNLKSEEEKIEVNPVFTKVKKELDDFYLLINIRTRREKKQLTQQEMSDIALKYENLTYPFRLEEFKIIKDKISKLYSTQKEKLVKIEV